MGRHAEDAEERARAFEEARRRKEEEGKPPWRPPIWATLLALVLVPIFFYFLPTTVETVAGSGAGDLVQPARHGTGEVRECSQVGPVSRQGFGLWWICQVSVNWDDGGHGVYPAEDSQFNPAEVGHSFRVELGGLGWGTDGGVTVNKIPHKYLVLRSGLERRVWTARLTLLAGIPFGVLSGAVAFVGVWVRWTDFTNFLRERLPDR